MKLLRLNLRAVGPFSGAVLDLSAGHEGLHLIYGRNEAGKTSALRAISHLLFGFPHLSSDNFVHPNDQLRVGGTLRHSNGEELEILRRRGRSNTLRGPDDSSVVPDQWQRQFLGDLNQATFESLFGINHERLSQAGEEIRTGKGTRESYSSPPVPGWPASAGHSSLFNKASMISSSRELRTRGSTRP